MGTRTDKTDAALPGAPAAPDPKPKKVEHLHVAYLPSTKDDDAVSDVIVFGTRPDALEHAIANDGWKVATVVKGQALTAVLKGGS